MPEINFQELSYGVIYVCGNPKQTHNLRWFASMIEPMIRPLTLKWVETWEIDHTLIITRRFNIGNMGKYATVQLHLNKYGRSDSYSLLAALHAFSDCLEDVMDASEGDVIINEADYSDRNELPQGKWGKSVYSAPMGDVFNEFELDLDVRQDNTRVEESPRMELPQAAQPQVDYGFTGKEEKCLESRSRWNLKSLRRKRKKDESVIEESDHHDKFIIREESLKNKFPDIISNDDTGASEYNDDDSLVDYIGSDEVELLNIEAEEVAEFRRIESEYERDVKDLRARIVAFITKYHQDPKQLMATMLEGKVLLGSTPGRVLVNGDMKIVLPDYDELEIEMPAMSRTLYILFMKHRKQGGAGIVLRNIDEYRDEIMDIYGLVKPGANEARVAHSVDNLCNPLSDSLNQTISRINRCIKNVITDKGLAQAYCVTGDRGREYGIQLDPQYLALPRAVTGV